MDPRHRKHLIRQRCPASHHQKHPRNATEAPARCHISGQGKSQSTPPFSDCLHHCSMSDFQIPCFFLCHHLPLERHNRRSKSDKLGRQTYGFGPPKLPFLWVIEVVIIVIIELVGAGAEIRFHCSNISPIGKISKKSSCFIKSQIIKTRTYFYSSLGVFVCW